MPAPEMIDVVAVELHGMSFKLLQAALRGLIPASSIVQVTKWGTPDDVASIMHKKQTATVPKHALDPLYTPIKSLRRYDVALSNQRKVVDQSLAQLAANTKNLTAHAALKAEYQKAKNTTGWEKQQQVLLTESDRINKQLAGRKRELSRMLVRQVMYNRFDQAIAQWCKHYTKLLSPATPLDPNIIKSMAFEESDFGTFGEHLLLPPYDWTAEHHKLKTRFNIIQAVDSAEEQQLLMIEEMAPEVFKKYSLDALKKKHRKDGLKREDFYAWNAGKFVGALDAFFITRNSAGNNLMGHPRDLHEDYEFWIRTAIRWLFVKYNGEWKSAVKGFNGDGVDARNYRDRIMKRTGSASPFNAQE